MHKDSKPGATIFRLDPVRAFFISSSYELPSAPSTDKTICLYRNMSSLDALTPIGYLWQPAIRRSGDGQVNCRVPPLRRPPYTVLCESRGHIAAMMRRDDRVPEGNSHAHGFPTVNPLFWRGGTDEVLLWQRLQRAGPATASVRHGNHAGQSTGHIWERRFCDGVPAPFRFTG